MRRPARWRLAAALFFLVIELSAPAGEAPLKLARLDLVDGRTLTNVVIKSYDPASGRLLLVADGTAMLIPAGLVPPPFGERLKLSAPRAGATMSVVGTPPAPEPKPASPTAAPDTTAAADLAAAAAIEQQVLASHRQVAEERARRYFEFEYQAGASAITVTKLDIQTKPPEPIDGWPGRYRTRGKALLEYYVSQGRSFARGASRFEVITEQRADQSVTVVDFAPR